jgi:hypothetical protein
MGNRLFLPGTGTKNQGLTNANGNGWGMAGSTPIIIHEDCLVMAIGQASDHPAVKVTAANWADAPFYVAVNAPFIGEHRNRERLDGSFNRIGVNNLYLKAPIKVEPLWTNNQTYVSSLDLMMYTEQPQFVQSARAPKIIDDTAGSNPSVNVVAFIAGRRLVRITTDNTANATGVTVIYSFASWAGGVANVMNLPTQDVCAAASSIVRQIDLTSEQTSSFEWIQVRATSTPNQTVRFRIEAFD